MEVMKYMRTLYNHQETALDLLRKHPRYALYMEMGTGKTLVTLRRIVELFQAGEIKRTLIVCPKCVIQSWKNEIEAESMNDMDIVVTNYEQCKNIIAEYDMVVLDESHYIKTPTTQRSKHATRLVHAAKYAVLLTGTPIGQGYIFDLWSQMNALDPDIYGKRYPFYKRYGWQDKYYKWHCSTDKQNEVLHKAYKYSYWIRKEDCLDLPDKMPPVFLYAEALHGESRKAYNGIAKTGYYGKTEAIYPMVKMTLLRRLSSGHLFDNDENFTCGKIKVLLEFLEALVKPIVVFANFKQSIRDIESALKDAGYDVVVADGDHDVASAVEQFQGRKADVIICQYAAANVGVNLQRASDILYYEPTISSTAFSQSMDRVHRIGQTSTCNYYLLCTTGTLEEQIYKAILDHKDFTKRCFEQYLKEV
jgi:SNF2 family DNA or RNA helicase